MWENKITDFFENLSEYDNNELSLHNAIDIIDMLKERVTFSLNDDNEVIIKVLKKPDDGEDVADEIVDDEGFMYWCHMIYHKEIIDDLLRLREKVTSLQNEGKRYQSESKLASTEEQRNQVVEKINTNSKDVESNEVLMSKIDSYRRNTFTYLSDIDEINKLLSTIKVIKEHS